MADKPLDTNEMLESPEIFEEIYESHSKSIYRFLYWRTKNVELAEDLTSSVFEKAWRSRGSFHGGSVQAWLYRIARNVLIDHWRKKKELFVEDTDTFHEEENSPSLADRLDKEIVINQLREAMNKLPSEMKSVVTLRFIEGLSGKQVARALSLSESNVRVIQYRALQKLKGHLK